jgi:hypothetical protein
VGIDVGAMVGAAVTVTGAYRRCDTHTNRVRIQIIEEAGSSHNEQNEII